VTVVEFSPFLRDALIRCISDASICQLVHGLVFRQAWAVIDLADALLASPFAEEKSRRACVSDNVPSNRLFDV